MAVQNKKLMGVVAGAVALAVAVGGFVAYRSHAAAADISGVWRGQTSGLTYVIDKHDDGYRLSVSGHRLTVKSAEKDGLAQQLNFNVRTDSGLLAVWSFKSIKGDGTTPPALHLDQDGILGEDLQLQRELTSADRSRLAQLKPAKKALWSPSFDCGKAGTDAERMVCTDPDIAKLDVTMARQVHSSAAVDATVTGAQKNWLHTVRDACTDITCVRNAYQQRLDELNAASAPATAEDATPAEAAPAQAPQT